MCKKCVFCVLYVYVSRKSDNIHEREKKLNFPGKMTSLPVVVVQVHVIGHGDNVTRHNQSRK